MNIKLASIAVFGPQGSGKSKHAKALAHMFGLRHIIEEPDLVGKINPFDTLYLTQTPILYVKSISIETALKMLELE